MAKKKTSKKLATIAGRFLAICQFYRQHETSAKNLMLLVRICDIEALAGSVLSQYEADKKVKK